MTVPKTFWPSRRIYIAATILLWMWCGLCLYPTNLQAQPSEPQVQHYGVDDGLPGSEIWDILEDSLGYIWIATNNGLCRFDGHHFQSFSEADGIADNEIKQLFLDHRGRIWMLGFSHRVTIYEQGQFRPYRFNAMLEKRFKFAMFGFVVEPDNTVFFGSQLEGYLIVHPNQSLEDCLPNDHPIGFHIEDKEGRLRIYGNSKPKTKKKVFLHTDRYQIEFNVDKIHKTRKSRWRMSVLKLSEDKVMLMGGAYFFNYDEHNQPFIDSISNVNIISAYLDHAGQLWMGDAANGVFALDTKTKSITNRFLKGTSVTTMKEDHEHGFWIGTWQHGLYYAPSRKVQNYTSVLGNPVTNKIAVAPNGDIYAGMGNGKVWVIRDKQLIRSHDLTTRDDVPLPIQMIKYDPFRKDMIACKVGLNTNFSLPLDMGPPSRIIGMKPMFMDVDFLENGNMIAATHVGLLLHDQKRNFTKLLTKQRTLALEIDGQNNYWVGKHNGLHLYESDKLKSKAPLHPALAKKITGIDLMHDDWVAVGTHGSGLVLFKGDSVLHFDAPSWLSSNLLNQVFVDGNDRIWVTSNRGVDLLWKNKDAFKVRHFGKKDGLISNEVNDIVVIGDEVWLATQQGISTFHLQDMPDQAAAPPIVIQGIKVNDAPVKGTQLNLKHHQNAIAIDYVGISYKAPDQLTYQYRLKGMHDQWLSTAAKNIQFGSINPGHYQFEVLAVNKDGIHSTEPARLILDIAPPFWATAWFIALVILLILVVVYGSVQFWGARIKRKEQEKNEIDRQINELNLKALRAQMNPHFTFNTLGSIQNYIADNNKEASQSYLSKFAKLIRAILDNSEHGFITISSELETLQYYIDLEKLRFDDGFEYEIKVDSAIDTEYEQIPTMLIQPFVENAIWHGLRHRSTKGKIIIQLQKDGNWIRCSIQDNGVGRKKARELEGEHQYDSKGMGITIDRLRMLFPSTQKETYFKITDLEDASGKGTGTLIEFKIPFQ